MTSATGRSALKNAGFFVVFASMIFLAYADSFDASWHFDDKPNIVDNQGLHIKNLQPQSLVRAFFTVPKRGGIIGKKLYRPVACLSLALNWYFGQKNVFGYHLINVSVHILTAYLLFLAIIELLKTPNLRSKFQSRQYFIAFLAAALWALNPIQTQAVTYIVQRMAAMAAMFYISSMYLYLKFRQSDSALGRILLLLGVVLGFVFALGSKENAVMLPAALFLVEIICFQDLHQQAVRRRICWLAIGGGLFLAVLGAWVFIPGSFLSFVKGYQGRPFSLSERLLTEPRIVLFYLSQIFYPVPTRLSIEHDIVLSTSLLQPWTTLPAILIILALVGIGIFQLRKRPLLALAILFYFLNQLVESTVIPLELIFEHRNYLPSLFVFLPVAAGFSGLLEHYAGQNPAFRNMLAGFLVLLLAGFGWGTYVRNLAWKTEKSLWQDAMVKAPRSGRPLHNLAWGYYAKTGQYDKALQLYEKSLHLQRVNKFSRALALNNMALIYFQQKDFQKAIDLWQQALVSDPNFKAVRYRYAIALAALHRWGPALGNINRLIAERPGNFDYNYQKGYILLHQEKYEQALSFFEFCLAQRPAEAPILTTAGICSNLMGRYEQAKNYLEAGLRGRPGDRLTLLWLIANSLQADNQKDADRYIEKLLRIVPAERLLALLKNKFDDNLMPAASKKRVIGAVARKLGDDPEKK